MIRQRPWEVIKRLARVTDGWNVSSPTRNTANTDWTERSPTAAMALEQVIMRPRMTVVSGARRSVMYSLALRSDCSWNYWPHLFTAASAEFQGHRKSLSFSIQLKHLLVRNRKLSCRKKNRATLNLILHPPSAGRGGVMFSSCSAIRVCMRPSVHSPSYLLIYC